MSPSEAGVIPMQVCSMCLIPGGLHHFQALYCPAFFASCEKNWGWSLRTKLGLSLVSCTRLWCEGLAHETLWCEGLAHETRLPCVMHEPLKSVNGVPLQHSVKETEVMKCKVQCW